MQVNTGRGKLTCEGLGSYVQHGNMPNCRQQILILYKNYNLKIYGLHCVVRVKMRKVTWFRQAGL